MNGLTDGVSCCRPVFAEEGQCDKSRRLQQLRQRQQQRVIRTSRWITNIVLRTTSVSACVSARVIQQQDQVMGEQRAATAPVAGGRQMETDCKRVLLCLCRLLVWWALLRVCACAALPAPLLSPAAPFSRRRRHPPLPFSRPSLHPS